MSLELFQFICEHRRVLDQLMAQHHTLKWSGSFYRCIAQTLRVQRAVLEVSKPAFMGRSKNGMLMEAQSLRTALDAKYPLIRMNTAEDWNELSARMLEATNTYVIGD